MLLHHASQDFSLEESEDLLARLPNHHQTEESQSKEEQKNKEKQGDFIGFFVSLSCLECDFVVRMCPWHFCYGTILQGRLE